MCPNNHVMPISGHREILDLLTSQGVSNKSQQSASNPCPCGANGDVKLVNEREGPNKICYGEGAEGYKEASPWGSFIVNKKRGSKKTRTLNKDRKEVKEQAK